MDDNQHNGWKDVNAFRAWLTALLRDQELQDIATKSSRKPYSIDIRTVAICIAVPGSNGYGCFPSAETVANDYFGCSERTIRDYRATLIRLGWFRITSRNGGSNRRALVLDISIPAEKK
jgi:hypothetical protein